MKAPRIVNRGRIAPSSPKPVINSGRTSWSTASLVSTIDTKSPEPDISEQVNQKLQKTVSVASTKKKLIVCLTIATLSLLIVGTVLGAVLPSILNKSPLTTTSTTVATTMEETTITLATTTIPTIPTTLATTATPATPTTPTTKTTTTDK